MQKIGFILIQKYSELTCRICPPPFSTALRNCSCPHLRHRSLPPAIVFSSAPSLLLYSLHLIHPCFCRFRNTNHFSEEPILSLGEVEVVSSSVCSPSLLFRRMKRHLFAKKRIKKVKKEIAKIHYLCIEHRLGKGKR